MAKVKITLAIGIALILAVLALTLTKAPPRVLRTGVPAPSTLGSGSGDVAICQAGEVVPSGTSGIRLALGAFYGARLHLKLSRGSQTLAQGSRGADWTGKSVTVPVDPLAHATSGATLCFALGPNSEPVIVGGLLTSRSRAAVIVGKSLPRAGVKEETEPLPGKVGVEYLGSGRSWWSQISTVARHIGIGHVLSGTWVALLLAALMAAVGVLAVALTLRELP